MEGVMCVDEDVIVLSFFLFFAVREVERCLFMRFHAL